MHPSAPWYDDDPRFDRAYDEAVTEMTAAILNAVEDSVASIPDGGVSDVWEEVVVDAWAAAHYDLKRRNIL